jgi:hypothetical protein
MGDGSASRALWGNGLETGGFGRLRGEDGSRISTIPSGWERALHSSNTVGMSGGGRHIAQDFLNVAFCNGLSLSQMKPLTGT